MDQFKNYSKYYDIIYKDKNYKEEANFINKSFKKFGGKRKKLLSLGCGTCSYELLMASNGYTITGIDRSKEMLSGAFDKVKRLKLDSQVKMFEKDIRNFSFNEKFDVAMAMFNIVGYQTKNEDFEKTLKNVSNSLKRGGIFVFDCWYMPAVLKDKPTDRIKKIKTKEGSLIRLTKSTLHINENVIEINFDVTETKKGKVTGRTNETHYMRYWSLPELKYFIEKAGLSLIKTCNFMDWNSEISENNWNIFVVARKKR